MGFRFLTVFSVFIWSGNISHSAERNLTSENLHSYLSVQIGQSIEQLSILSSINVEGIELKISDVNAFCVGFFGKKFEGGSSRSESALLTQPSPTAYYIVGTRQKGGSNVYLERANSVTIDGTNVSFVYSKPHPTKEHMEVVIVKKNVFSGNAKPMVFESFECKSEGKTTNIEYVGQPVNK